MDVARKFVERVSRKPVRSAMHLSNNLRLKLRASRAATKLYHRCCVEQARQEVKPQARVNMQEKSVFSTDLQLQTDEQQGNVGECFSTHFSSQDNLDQVDSTENDHVFDINPISRGPLIQLISRGVVYFYLKLELRTAGPQKLG